MRFFLDDVRCVVFDLDDTLYPEEDYIRSGFAALADFAASELGVENFAEQAWRLHESGVRGKIFNRILEGRDDLAERVPELVMRYRKHHPTIELLPEARETLDALREEYVLALITDGPSDTQRPKIEALGVEPYFRKIIVTGEMGREFWKPHPRAFERVEKATGFAGVACVYIGDNASKDFLAPAQRGWRTVRIRRGNGLYREIPSGPEVEHEIDDLRRLLISSAAE